MNPAVLDRLVERAYRVTLTFTEPILGGMPTTSIAAQHVKRQQVDKLAHDLMRANGLSRARASEEALARLASDARAQVEASSVALAESDEDDEPTLNVTAFPQDDGGLFLWDYQIKGFLKGKFEALKPRVAGKGEGSKVSPIKDLQLLTWIVANDGTLSRRCYLTRDGAAVTTFDDLCERPLRARTPQGERVSIAVSERLYPPLSVTCRLLLIRGNRLSHDQLEELLTMGLFEGIGQWRSSGLGRFDMTLEAITA